MCWCAAYMILLPPYVLVAEGLRVRGAISFTGLDDQTLQSFAQSVDRGRCHQEAPPELAIWVQPLFFVRHAPQRTRSRTRFLRRNVGAALGDAGRRGGGVHVPLLVEILLAPPGR
jgi:hypothetical protein